MVHSSNGNLGSNRASELLFNRIRFLGNCLQGNPNPKELGHGGVMVGALDSASSGSVSIPDQGHSVVFLDKTLDSYSASLHPGILMSTRELNALV